MYISGYTIPQFMPNGFCDNFDTPAVIFSYVCCAYFVNLTEKKRIDFYLSAFLFIKKLPYLLMISLLVKVLLPSLMRTR